MNSRDVTAVLGVLAAAWPNQTITEQTARVWMDLLADIDSEDAMAAARILIKREHWFPSVAQFRSEAEAQAHGRHNRAAATRGLPGPTTPVLPERLVDATREFLAERGTKKHWHGGPEPCPVCGGIKPGDPT